MNELFNIVLEAVAAGLVGYLFVKLRIFMNTNQALKDLKMSKETEDFIQSLATIALKIALNKAKEGLIPTPVYDTPLTKMDLIDTAKADLAVLIDRSPNKLKASKFDLGQELLKVVDTVKIPKNL